MGIPIVDVMVAECEGVRRNMEIGAGCLVWKGVVYQNYAVMRARALRQQSAVDFEVWLKRCCATRTRDSVETLHVSCNIRSLHLLSTGLRLDDGLELNHRLRKTISSFGLQHKQNHTTSHSRSIQETVALRNTPNTASRTHDHVHVLLDETTCECLYSTLMTWRRRPSLQTRRP